MLKCLLYRQKKRSFQVGENETVKIRVSVEKRDGVLNVYIAKDGDKENAIYKGEDITTSEFIVSAKEAGDYIIWIEADNFEGEYSFEISSSK